MAQVPIRRLRARSDRHRQSAGRRQAVFVIFAGLAMLAVAVTLILMLTSPAGLVCSRLAVGPYYVRLKPAPLTIHTTPQLVSLQLTDRQRRIVEFGVARMPARDAVYVPFGSRFVR